MAGIGDLSERAHSISSSSSSTSNSIPVGTPTHTTTSSFFEKFHDAAIPPSPMSSSTFTINGGTSSIPEPGGTYMIRDLESGKAITLVNGRLTLVLNAGTRGGWQWHCEEVDDGWVGFRDAVSGKYLGHDNKGGFQVQASKLYSWESFVLRPREAGGCNLWVKYGSKLKAMGIADKDEPFPTLIQALSAKEAARWEFVKV
ncbi:hypothetical protein HD806DRAFT_508192 [Xylariaceae sp. AK1471]|nr:hypothetical protein HD806DRAFT_508192 [Xylariaceae sp. AK1471]